MFLEDRDAQEQFIISTADGIYYSKSAWEISDWTLYTNRRKLIRVMRFAADQGLLELQMEKTRHSWTMKEEKCFMKYRGIQVFYEELFKRHYGIYETGRFSGK